MSKTAERDAARFDRVHFVNVLWGESFRDFFLDVSLPTQLGPGNFGLLRGRRGPVYVMYTTREDEAAMRRSPVFQELQACLPVEFRYVELDENTPGWQTFTNAHKDAIREGHRAGVPLVFLTPDIVIGDGAWRTLERLVGEGKRAVIYGSVRINKDSFTPEFLRDHRPAGETAVAIEPQPLVEMGIRHLHEISHALCYPPRSTWPSHLYWPVPGQGLIARCFHAHPLLVAGRARDIDFSSTIDGDYLEQAGILPEEVHVVRDTDEIAIFELSRADYQMGPRDTPMRDSEIGMWASLYANRTHRQMFRHAVAYHSQPLGPVWQAARDAADRDYRRIQRWVGNGLFRVAIGMLLKPVRDRLAVVYRATWRHPRMIEKRQRLRQVAAGAYRRVKTAAAWIGSRPAAARQKLGVLKCRVAPHVRSVIRFARQAIDVRKWGQLARRVWIKAGRAAHRIESALLFLATHVRASLLRRVDRLRALRIHYLHQARTSTFAALYRQLRAQVPSAERRAPARSEQKSTSVGAALHAAHAIPRPHVTTSAPTEARPVESRARV